MFDVFEREQKDNANAIADMALENYVEMRDTVRDPKHLVRHDLAFALEERLPGRSQAKQAPPAKGKAKTKKAKPAKKTGTKRKTAKKAASAPKKKKAKTKSGAAKKSSPTKQLSKRKPR